MKYIIEIKPEYEGTTKGIIVLGIKNNCLCVDELAVEELEELNSDYINEHFGQLQDEAYQKGLEEGKKAFDLLESERNSEYQRGFEDGKKVIHKGCEGCRYSGTPQGDSPCFSCSNYYPNNWQKQDDKIEVRDEVVWTEDENVAIVVTCIYTVNNIEWCDGVCKDGRVYSIITEHARKTGKNYDIDKILEEMKE